MLNCLIIVHDTIHDMISKKTIFDTCHKKDLTTMTSYHIAYHTISIAIVTHPRTIIRLISFFFHIVVYVTVKMYSMIFRTTLLTRYITDHCSLASSYPLLNVISFNQYLQACTHVIL